MQSRASGYKQLKEDYKSNKSTMKIAKTIWYM